VKAGRSRSENVRFPKREEALEQQLGAFLSAWDANSLRFASTVFATDQAVYDAAQNVGADVVITLDIANTITLENLQKAALTLTDFHIA
jgi:hypothetical protein